MTHCLASIMLGLALVNEPALESHPGASFRTRLRPLDRAAASLLREAPMRSPTIAHLLETIDASDLIAQVEVPRHLRPSSGGVTRLITASDDVRYVRITLSWQKNREETLILLGHELQHAVEIAGARHVRTQDDMRKFYRRAGFSLSHRKQFDTVAAVKTTRTVRSEIYKKMG